MVARYGDVAIQSADDYRRLMERDGTYAEQAEAAVAAKLIGVELTIYASRAPPGIEPSLENLYCEAASLGEHLIIQKPAHSPSCDLS